MLLAMAIIAGSEVRRAVRGANGWIEAAGRAGLVAHGIVYGLIGALALRTAFGPGRGRMGRKESLAAIADEPFGEALLVAVGVGLLGYALWRAIEVVMDP